MIKIYKRVFFPLLIVMIIGLHAVLRLSELPYSKVLLSGYVWVPAINYAAGQGFSEDATCIEGSPELANFLLFTETVYGKPSGKKLSLSDTFHYQLTNCKVKTNYHEVKFAESIGYRIILGLVWKYFGFNWYFVGLINYFLSLMALFALLYCSYRTLGSAYSIAIGLIFSLSLPEIQYTVNFGRDGIPLWFASYLICALVMFFNKRLTLKRITSYAILIGIIIYGAMQGRSSCLYFLPLIAAIYFVVFIMSQKKEIDLKYIHFLKGDFGKKLLLFFFATGLTFLFALVPQKLTEAMFPYSSSCFPHWIFLGLGMWGQVFKPFHPSQVRYQDTHVAYLVLDYGQRVLNHAADSLDYLSKPYGDVVLKMYLSFVKTYPYFFFRYVVWGSFHKTLLYLGVKNSFYYIRWAGGVNQFFGYYIKFLFVGNFLFVLSVIGSLLLYLRLKLKKIAIILVFFILYNAGVSFIQFHPRHVLMGHPAYYFLSGVTLGFIFDQYIKNAFHFFVKAIGLFSPSKGTSPKIRSVQIISFFNTLSRLTINRKGFIKTIQISLVVLIGAFFIYFIQSALKSVEDNNIHEMQVFFDSLEKSPLEFDVNEKQQKILKIPPSLISKTIGIYCELGPVTLPKKIIMEIHHPPSYNGLILTYHTEIMSSIGENVMLFFPFYFIDKETSMKVDDNNQCRSFQWADLKDWKGFLWEGSYDKNTLINK